MNFSEKSIGAFKCISRDSKIVVYTSSGCPRCLLLKEWLRSKNIGFEERNLEDINVMTDLIMRNVFILSAPALEVEGAFYTGNQIFDGNGLVNDELLKVLGGK